MKTEEQWEEEALKQEQDEPVSHLWECIGRWSAYLANNGMSAELAPPSWLVDAINKAITLQTKEWVGLTNEQIVDLVIKNAGFPTKLAKAIEAKLKEKNT